ncbi:MAG: sulfotransferase [Candidatus Saganbacteria bacterium]|nr:sulfotransferase [Candidatus Saganbacteria bacterium]
MVKTFFITGNKRSGTSQLVRLLNLHPEVYISLESDVIWILHQFDRDVPFSPYPEDSPLGMNYTLKTCAHILDKNKSLRENYLAVETLLMERGSPWLPPMKKKDLRWVGDKKPFQNADPKLIEFILEIFPGAHFMHLIRHPFAVCESARKFNETPNGDFWKGLTLEGSLERWTLHEKGVLGLKKKIGERVIDIRYEDLCRHTGNEMARVFGFLGLHADNSLLNKASQMTKYRIKNTPTISCSEEAKSIMRQYGYKPEGISLPKLALGISNRYFEFRKGLI